jgi:hypothetical protein
MRDGVIDFKRALRQEARDRGFVRLVDLESKTTLAHSTVSLAFNEGQSLPTAETVHQLVQAWGGDTAAWERRRRVVADAAVHVADEPADAAERSIAVSVAPPLPSGGGGGLIDGSVDGTDRNHRTVGEEARAVQNDGSGPRRLGGWRGRAVVMLILVVAAVVLVMALRPVGTSAPDASRGTDASSADGQLFSETVIPENSVRTLGNPLTAQGLGASIPASTTVEVSCRVYSAEIPSALPDGYFYRVESAPWNGDFYAAANSFLNGDPAGQVDQYLTPTDLSVPLCDGV